MNENGAAAILYARARVVIDFDDEIVEMIVALEPIADTRRGKLDRAIVAAVVRVLAPGVVLADAAYR